MKTMVAGITEKFPFWDCVILQEIDTHKSSDGPDICDVADAMQPHLLMRSYGGQGCHAMAILIHARKKLLVHDIFCTPRCMSLVLGQGNHKKAHILNIHGYLNDCESTVEEMCQHVSKFRGESI